MNAPLVDIKHLTKRFSSKGPSSLDDITATVERGQFVGVAGPDASGKTTLLRLIAGLMLPTKGSITINGLDTVKDQIEIHNLIGYMPQKFGLYEDLTVMQNLNLYADLRGLDPADREKVFERLLDFTSLEPFTKRLAGALSGGMKQKLGLACALIKKPTLLLLDEPTIGVDPVSRRELWKMVRELLNENITVIWSTAYLDEAERTDSVILLNDGKMVYHGPPGTLTERVKGRTFLVKNVSEIKHTVLKCALDQESIVDGIIQGSNLRLVTKEQTTESITLPCLPDDQAKIVPTPPRFEDAFIDILGGGPGSHSRLAELRKRIKSSHADVIIADNLTKKFGNFTAADNISFNVKRGEIFGLLGPNGAGKSTTFKMLCGLLKPNSGMAFVNGIDLLAAGSEARQQIGYMAQKFSQYGDLSVQENLDFFAGIYGLQWSVKRDVINEMLTTFDLTEYVDNNADSLPPGLKQRLALACAVMHQPSILFLDEPTSGVDPITRREFWTHINGLVEKGVTVMVTTHFMDEAEYCDRIAMIYQGKVIKIDSPDTLKEDVKVSVDDTPTLEDAFIRLIDKQEMAGNDG